MACESVRPWINSAWPLGWGWVEPGFSDMGEPLHTHTPWPSPWLSLVFVVRVHVVRVVGPRPMLLPLLLGLPLVVLLAELLGLLFVELFVELQLLPFGMFLRSTQYKRFVTKFALHHFELLVA